MVQYPPWTVGPSFFRVDDSIGGLWKETETESPHFLLEHQLDLPAETTVAPSVRLAPLRRIRPNRSALHDMSDTAIDDFEWIDVSDLDAACARPKAAIAGLMPRPPPNMVPPDLNQPLEPLAAADFLWR